MANLTICITEDNALPMIRYEEGGNVTEKYVTPQELIDALSQYGKDHTVIATPTLPKGTVFYKKTNRGELVVIEVEPVVSNVQMYNAVIEDVHFPKLLFAFEVNGLSVGKCHIVAVKDREIKDNTELFKYPYSNVSDGTACWSELPIKLNSLTELNRIPYRWFGSENTQCYYGSNNLSGLGYREFLEANRKSVRNEFDSGTLQSAGKTFAEWVGAVQNSEQ